MIRSLGAVISGMVVGTIVVRVVGLINVRLYPLPGTLDDPAALRAAMEQLPAGAFVLFLVAWLLGSLAGGWSAAAIATTRRVAHGLVFGALFLAVTTTNLSMIPHPQWTAIGAITGIPICAWLGALIARRTWDAAKEEAPPAANP